MPYATQQEITARYGEDFLYVVADRDDDDNLDTAAVDRALEDASGLIDSYLSTRFTVPLSEPPALLARYCVDIAVYWLSENGGGLTDEKRQRYDDAIKWLGRVNSGDTDLGLALEPGTDEGSSSGGAFFQSSDRLFIRDTLRGF